jgi:enoyl-CoA hydratase/carnithine racemase
MTIAMYARLADLLNDADKDEDIHVVLLHGAGDYFNSGNDLEDFVKNPPCPGDSPQGRLIGALIDVSKPLIAEVHGVAIGEELPVWLNSTLFTLPMLRSSKFPLSI